MSLQNISEKQKRIAATALKLLSKEGTRGHKEESDSDLTDLENRCRLCLTDEMYLLPVSKGKGGGIHGLFALQIDIVTSVKVLPSDHICYPCRTNVKRFYDFRLMCQRSDTRIRQAKAQQAKNERKDVETPQIVLPEGVSVVRVDGDGSRTYSRHSTEPVMTEEEAHWKLKAVKDGLSITPIPNKLIEEIEEDVNEASYTNGSHSEKPEAESEGHKDGANSHMIISHQTKSNSGADEMESLEVEVNPFMLMEDEALDQDPLSAAVNVKGHLLYPVIGNDLLSQRPIMPTLSGRYTDHERALELIKQMTHPSKKPTICPDGTYLHKPFKCDMCPESFSYYKSFTKHKQRHTGESQTFQCDFCPEIFPTTRQLANHLKIHNVEKDFPCDQCARSFPTKERLQSHYTLHTGNKPHVCEICNKTFAYKSSYGLHLRKQHPEQPIKSSKFKCDRCSQEYSVFIDFKRHLRTHYGEKPFTCTICYKAFASKSILNVHCRIHAAAKPFRCTVCGQSFTQKQSLIYHMRRHDDKHPYKCGECGLSFQRRLFLDQHIETQHTGSSARSKEDSEEDPVIIMDQQDQQSELENVDSYESDPLEVLPNEFLEIKEEVIG